jgi:ubiquinone biosynthesis protein
VVIRRIGLVGRTYRHVDRYRQILTVLIRHGFGDLLESLKIDQYIEVGLKIVAPGRRQEPEHLTRAERFRMALEELGPTFIKLGQVLSTRPDLLPVEFMVELEKLQDDVPPFPGEDAVRLVEEELARPLTEAYERFDETPLASASLGQVHRATIVGGDEVVVKVQRPDVSRTVDVDLEILLHLAGLLERHAEGWEHRQPTRIVEEFARSIHAELDYRLEASHMERFAWQFATEATIRVPKVYREVSGGRVLTIEYVEGVKPVDAPTMEAAGLDPRTVAHRGARLLMTQVLVHGFFHADPHPGNLFVLPNNVVCFLDFGMMGRVDRRTREDFADLVMAIVLRDEEKTAAALLRITEWDEEPDRDALVRDLDAFIDRHLSRTLKELNLGRLLTDVLEAVERHRLRIPPNLFLMLKAMVTVEGVGQRLDPEFDITAVAEPFIRKVQADRLRPTRLAGEALGTGRELLVLMRDLPGEMRELIRQVRKGRLKLEFEHHRLDPLITGIERVSNRLAFAIVLASLIIGSALIVLADVPPKLGEIPIIGLVGFVLAGLMGFWLLISILTHGRM